MGLTSGQVGCDRWSRAKCESKRGHNVKAICRCWSSDGLFRVFSSTSCWMKPRRLLFLHPLTVMSNYLSALKCSHSPLKSHFHPNSQATEKHAPLPAFVSPNTLSSVCPDFWELISPTRHRRHCWKQRSRAQGSSGSCSRQRHSAGHTCCVCVCRSRMQPKQQTPRAR